MTDIRPATPADVPLIVQFVRDLAEFEREPESAKATEPMLHAALFGADAVAEAVIAEIEGKPMGFALFFRNFSTWTGLPGLYLEDLYVTPEARGAGVGTVLLRHLAKIAHDRGYARFEWAVLDWNQPAIDFYEKMGAQAMDEWRIRRVTGEALKRLAEG